MEKSEDDSSSNSEKEKTAEKSIKTSDIKKDDNKDNKVFYSVYGSGSVEEEEKEPKNNINTNINKIEEETLSSENKDLLIEKNLTESVMKMENITKEKLDLAEKINYKNSTDTLVETDEFGFFKNKDEKDKENNKNNNNDNKIEEKKEDKITKEELLKINARIEKWQYMLAHYKSYQSYKKYKLKSRTRKGIPDSLRSYVWQLFAKTDKLVEKGLFEKLDKEAADPEIESVIIKDLDRTFPKCQLFKEKYGKGQRKLFRVLNNYSKYNKNLGYVQGMGYLVAIFLLYMDEESAFYMLHAIIKNYGVEGLYLPGFPDLKKKFYVLLNLEKKFIPKIYDILKRDDVYISIYASEWLLCLFSKDLKPSILVRIIDVFLYEGYKVVYRFALAFLKMKEKNFISNKKGIFYAMNTIKQLFDDVDVDELFKVAFSFSLSRSHIAKYESEYEENKGNPNNEFMKQL